MNKKELKRSTIKMIRFGCHGSTWELDYDKEMDYLDQIIEVVSKAGFKSIDVQVALLGRYKNDPERLLEKLHREGIELAALTLPFTWENETETEDEKKRADYYINYVKYFPYALLNVPSRNGPNRDDLLKRQKDIISCANALGKRAYENGVVTSFHPESPPTSYFRTAEDYKVLFEELDTRYMGYTPDAGHIEAGGMNAFEVIKNNLSIIKHVHFKDYSKKSGWKRMGTGEVDFQGIVQLLKDNHYTGWIMIEEETEEAAKDPDKVISDIGNYVIRELNPIVKNKG
jgi:inosose dehydratase